MSKLPDLAGFAFFAKVVEEKSFAAAARALGVSVSTVSRGVSDLEVRLGARLFNRTSRKIALTEVGLTMSEGASRLLADAETMENLARESSSSPRGRIRLAVPMSFGLRWVAPLMPELFALYPEISVDLHLTDARVDLIGEGFDAALRIAVSLDGTLIARKLTPVAPVLVTAPSYLQMHKVPKHPRDLAAHNCLGYAYRTRSDVWRFTSQSGAEETVTPRGSLSVTNVDALIPMLLAGQAIAELPDFIAQDYLADGRLQALLPKWTLPHGALYFVTPSARSRPAKIEVLAAFFAERLMTLKRAGEKAPSRHSHRLAQRPR